MRAFAASSTLPVSAEAVLDVAAQLRARGARGGGDGFALAFSSYHHARDPRALSQALSDTLSPLPFLGWVGASAFHGLSLHEGEPGLAVLVVEGAPAYVRSAPQQGLGSHVAAGLCADAPCGRARFLAAPPDELDATSLLRSLDEQRVPTVGAVALAPGGVPTSALAPDVGDGPHAGLLSADGVALLTGVAQGARPLGPSRRVTSAQGSVVHLLDGGPAADAMMADLPPALRQDLAALRGSLFAGIAPEGGAAFVMRHVVGLDPTSGALAIADEIPEGAELVFALRDAEAARADLEETLASLVASLEGRRPLAALVFSGLSRDEASFGVPLYDVGRVDDLLGGDTCPVVGLACSNELATVGARTELFGYACVISVLLAER